MVVQKFKIDLYKKPQFAKSYEDKGIISIEKPEFITFDKDDVKRLGNAVRIKRTSDKEYKDAVTDFENRFTTEGGWNPKYSAGLFCWSYDSRGNKYRELLGFHTRAYSSSQISCKSPFCEVKFLNNPTETELNAYKLRLKQLENRQEDRVIENKIQEGDVTLSLQRAKDSWNDLESSYKDDGLNKNQIETKMLENDMGETLEKYLHTILLDYGKDPKVKKWNKIIDGLLGNEKQSSFGSIFTTTSEVTEFFKTQYDGEFTCMGQPLTEELIFNDTNKVIPQLVFLNVTELYKPFYIYSSSVQRFIMNMATQIDSENTDGSKTKWLLFLGIYNNSSVPMEKNIDKNRKDMMKKVNECLHVLTPSIRKKIQIVGFIGQKNSERGEIVNING